MSVGPSSVSERDVFIVGSPFQLLCADEARRAHAVPDDAARLLVIGGGEREATRQLDALIERQGWSHVERVQPGEGVDEPVERSRTTVHLGDYREPDVRSLARSLSAAPPVLLDDGSATLLVAARRRRRWWRATDVGSMQLVPSRRVPVPGLVRDAVRWRSREPAAVTYFTFYDVAVREPDRVERHAFEHLRATLSPHGTPADVLVGSNLVESGVLRRDVGDALLASLVALAPDALYVAHRREDAGKLRAIERRHGLTVHRPDLPIELELDRLGIRPRTVLGTLSTALDTLALLHPGAVIERRLPALDDVAPRSRRAFRILAAAVETVPGTLHDP